MLILLCQGTDEGINVLSEYFEEAEKKT